MEAAVVKGGGWGWEYSEKNGREGCTKPGPASHNSSNSHSLNALGFQLHNIDRKKLKESCHRWEAVFHSIHSICSILFALLLACCADQGAENKQIRQGLREAPSKMSALLFGHCPKCDCTTPPHSIGHSGALYFRTNLSNFVKSPFWWW